MTMSDKGMMPRDSLGRMVYVGDTVEGLGVVDEADDGGFLFFKAFLGHLPVASRSVTVDLASSPPRTNYVRYFADIGTREEVIEASDVCVHDTWIPCSTCVFEGWGESFGCRDDGCGGFDEWLDTHAVI